VQTPATIVTLSEGGMGIRTNVAFEEGDEARIRLLPPRGGPIDVHALVWNESKRFDQSQRTSLRTFGCVVSDPPAAFLRLIDEMAKRDRPIPPRRVRPVEPEPTARKRADSLEPQPQPKPKLEPRQQNRTRPAEPESLEIVEEAPADPDLPCPKIPLPPHKSGSGEGQPMLRLRIKQVRGPRSRWLEVPSPSLLEAQIWIRQNLEGEWEILEIMSVKKAGHG
jgi:hypothetical protein